MSEAERIAKLCGEASPGSGGWNCLCPGHEDTRPSAHISDGDKGGIVIACRRGCSQEQAYGALKAKGYITPRVPRRTKTGEWFYRHADGSVLFRVERYDKPDGTKDYVQSVPDGAGDWVYSTRGLKRVLYNLPKVLKFAREGKLVFVVEGEKCSDALDLRGFCATTASMGAGKKWIKEYSEALTGAVVVIIADNDEAGIKHAEKVAQELLNEGIRCRVIFLSGVGPKGDIYDWFYLGHTEAELKELVRSTPVWSPALATREQAPNVIDFPTVDAGIPPGAKETESLEYFSDTEVANAERFVKEHADVAIWTPEVEWLINDGRRFEIDKRNRINLLAETTARGLLKAVSLAPLEQRKFLVKWAKQSLNRSNLSNTIWLSRAKMSASYLDFDTDPWLFNCQNGVLNLRTGAFREHGPDLRSLKLSKIAGVTYDPSATADLWEEALYTAQGGDQEVVDFIGRAVFVSLTGIVRDQKMFFVYGPGGNFKSLFLNTFLALTGEYGAGVRAKMFMKTNHESQTDNPLITVGKRLVTVSEIAENDKLDEVFVKDFTGGDPVRARGLYEESFEFKPVAKLWLRGNYKPYVTPGDDGIWRRMLIIPFSVAMGDFVAEHCAPGEDFQTKLNSMLSGILNWALMYGPDYIQNGLKEPKSIIAERDEYRNEVDVVGEFIRVRCQVGDGIGDWELATDLFKAFRQFCDDGNFYYGNANRFGREMTRRGFRREDKKDGEAYVGISLRK